MSVTTLRELFVHDLEDIFYAEKQLMDALGELAEQTDDEDITSAFHDHREETEGQIGRLHLVFDALDMEPETEKCEGIEGLLKEHETFVKEENPDQMILDLHNLGAAQKTEHYEITAYQNLASMAEQLGMDEATELLEANLEEERAALNKLTTFVDEFDYQSVPTQSAD